MAKIYFADGMDCELALQDGASVGDALATAAARLDVKKPHARFLALHAASATGAVEAAPLGRATALANGRRPVEINQCVGCTRKFFIKSFPGDDTAVLAPSDGEESTLPRHRAGVASMAWRTTR